MFVCKHCGVSVETLYAFINHAKGHKNTANFRFSCAVSECPCTFQSLSALKWHIRDGKKIECPMTGCKKYFRVKSSFSAHISRKHKCDFQKSVCANITEISVAVPDVNTEGFDDVEFQDGPAIQLDKDTFLTNLALFYLRMQSKMILPATTIQNLIDEFMEVHTNSMTHILSKVHEELTKLKIPDSKINEIISGLSKENLLKMYNEGYFKSDQTRKSFFKKHFNYVEPVQVYLGCDASGKERYFQYIPVNETLKAFLNNGSVKEQYDKANEQTPQNPHVLQDIRDGRKFKENTLYKEYSSVVSLILYQDAFEVVNPLGSGRKKHKLVAVYMTLSEVFPHNRSSIDPMQLVMLCREEDFKFFGQQQVFQPLLSDLKDMEEFGIVLGNGETVKGTVIAIVGDSLGSHCIGGFTENFSKSTHFCRYCLINRDMFKSKGTDLGPTRTKQSYQNSVSVSEGQGICDGVKFDSVFNRLKHFHVCDPGLPPCLAHDLLRELFQQIWLYTSNNLSL